LPEAWLLFYHTGQRLTKTAVPDLIHSVKYEADKGFPTGGSAHTTAYDFFTQHPEGAFQLMNVLSDLGIPRDVRHISGNGVHTYRFINAQGQSQLFKWYWLPQLGHRALVYDEATKIAGKNNNFQRVDLYNNIEAGNFPQWDFAVQLFPDDGTYMYKGIDLLIPTQIVPFEVNPPIRLGRMTLNRNPTNFFAEPESISFAPSNVVAGVSFVPDPLLQWRLMSYDDTATHRHGSPNGYLLPINRAIAPVNNNYRDGYMQPLIFTGDSTSSPNGIGGVVGSSANATVTFTGTSVTSAGNGPIGRFASVYDWFGQARNFWGTLDVFAQQHTVDAYRFELGNVANASVVQVYIDNILNNIDNCLARRVAFGLGADLPAIGSGPRTNLTTGSAPFPSLYPLTAALEPNKSLVGLNVAIISNDTLVSASDMNAILPLLNAQKITLTVVAPRFGELATGLNATASYITTSSIFFDAVFIGSISTNSSANGVLSLDLDAKNFVTEAYSHGKAIGALGSSGAAILRGLGLDFTPSLGLYSGDAAQVTRSVLDALRGPVRFPQRFPTDDVAAICGR
jgi:catalase